MIAAVLSDSSWNWKNAKVTSVQLRAPKPALEKVEGLCAPLWLAFAFFRRRQSDSPPNVTLRIF
jgi:hypothetical protein